jgi:hypothetical protein
MPSGTSSPSPPSALHAMPLDRGSGQYRDLGERTIGQRRPFRKRARRDTSWARRTIPAMATNDTSRLARSPMSRR